MNKTVLLLLALMIGGAGFTLYINNKSAPKASALLSGLTNNLSNVTGVVITHKGETITLAKQDTSWSIKERDNYAANTEKVRKLLFALSDLKGNDPRTKNKDKFSLLQVNGADKNQEGTAIAVAEGDKETHRLIMGKSAGSDKRFINYKDQAWLVSIDNVGHKVGDWLQNKLPTFKKDQWRSVTILSSEGDKKVYLDRLTPGQKNFALHNIPIQTHEAESSYTLSLPANALSDMALKDVQKDTFTGQPTHIAMYQGFDGLHMSVMVFQDKAKKTWLRFVPSYKPEGRFIPKKTDPKSLEGVPDKNNDKTNKDPKSLDTTSEAKVQLMPVDEVKTKVQSLTKDLQGWVYNLNNASAFTTSFDSLIKKIVKKDKPKDKSKDKPFIKK
jgi:hypothetical protein